MLRGSEVSKDSYDSPVKKIKTIKNLQTEIDSGQSTFKSGSSFTINNMLRQTSVYIIMPLGSQRAILRE